MATAIILVFLGILATGLLIAVVKIRILQRHIDAVLRVQETHSTDLARIASDTSEIADEVIKIADVLTEASRIKAAKSPTFDGDKIQEKSASLRYVPIARRRAQAEAASLGPATHNDRVRANNTRALETAG